MADEIEIGVKVNGLTKIKTELRELRGELVNATDPAEIEKLSLAAGKLSDKISDANERIKVFAAGSNFEVVGNGLGLIGNQLSSLDFEGAAESAKMLTSTIKGMNPKDVMDGFKGLMSTIGQLTKAFVQMGIKLLMNPLFLLVAVVAAVVIALVMLKDKISFVQKAFDMVGGIIKVVIQALKDLMDAMGLTAFAAEDSANRQIAANNKSANSYKNTTDLKVAQMDREINEMKALGKNTEKLELEKQDLIIKGANKEIALATNTNITLQNLKKKRGTDLSKEEKEQLQASFDTIQAEKANILNAESEKTVILNSGYKERSDKAKSASDKANADAKAAGDKSAADTQARLKAEADLQQKYIDEINSLLMKSDEEQLQLAKEKEKRDINQMDISTKAKSDALISIDAKYSILEEQLQQGKLDKLKEITTANELEIAKIKDDSRNAELNRQQKAELAEIDKITQDETAKQEAKKAVEDKYKMLKRDADAADFEEANTKELEKAENEALSFEKRLAIVDARDKALIANTQLNDEERKRIAQENSDARKAIDDAEAAAKSKNLDAIGNALGNAANVLGKSTAAGKAAAVAQATIDTYKSAQSAYASMSGIPVVGPALGAVAAGVAVAGGIMNVKKILSVKTPGGGGGGAAPSATAMPSTPSVPSFALYGKNNEANTATSAKSVEAQQANNITVTAVVSETEITSTQGRVAKMNSSGEL